MLTEDLKKEFEKWYSSYASTCKIMNWEILLNKDTMWAIFLAGAQAQTYLIKESLK